MDEIIADIDWSAPEDEEPISDDRMGLPSASEYPRIFACPGYLNLKARLPKKAARPASEEALSGQRIHVALANPNIDWPVFLKTDEENAMANKCWSQWLNLEAKHLRAGTGRFAFVEQRFFLHAESENTVVFSGQVDRAILQEKKVLAVDWKTGRIPVDSVESNMQIRAYAVLTAEGLGNTGHLVDEVIMAIIQPHVSDTPTVVRYTEEDLMHAREELYENLRRAADPRAKRIRGEHCRYCPCKADCPEAKESIIELLDAPEATLTTAEELSAFLDRINIAEKVIDALKAEAKRRLSEGTVIPGWELFPGRKLPTIVNPEIVFGRMELAGATQEDFLSTVKISKTALKELLRDKTGTKGKLLDQNLAEILEGCVIEKQSQPILGKTKPKI